MNILPFLSQQLTRRPFGLGSIALCLAAAGCGGGGGGNDGVGSGGSGTCVAPLSFYSGPVSSRTGLTILVDDVAFDLRGPRVADCSAAIVVDDDTGAMVSSDLLQPGMGLDVFNIGVNTAADGTRSAGASLVYLHDDVIGTVESVDVAASTLKVLGQTVTSNASTVYAGATDLSGLAPGQAVRVYAMYDLAASAYRATRIEALTSPPSQDSVTGAITGLDAAGKTFTLGGAFVSYAGIAGANTPALANGLMVQVHVQAVPQSDTWIATAVATVPTSLGASGDVPDRGIAGIISQFANETSFTLPNLQIDARAATITYAHGAPVNLGVGSYVLVHGRVAAGILVADTVHVESF
jgi:hypothetical protein